MDCYWDVTIGVDLNKCKWKDIFAQMNMCLNYWRELEYTKE